MFKIEVFTEGGFGSLSTAWYFPPETKRIFETEDEAELAALELQKSAEDRAFAPQFPEISGHFVFYVEEV